MKRRSKYAHIKVWEWIRKNLCESLRTSKAQRLMRNIVASVEKIDEFLDDLAKEFKISDYRAVKAGG